MKKIVLVISVFLLNFFSVLSQESTSEKFSYRSVSVSPAGFYVGENAGFAFNADVSFASGLNIFSLGFGAASEVTIMGSNNDDYYQVNLLYGREFQLTKWLVCDLYGEVGYFAFNTYEQKYTSNWGTEK